MKDKIENMLPVIGVTVLIIVALVYTTVRDIIWLEEQRVIQRVDLVDENLLVLYIDDFGIRLSKIVVPLNKDQYFIVGDTLIITTQRHLRKVCQ